MTVNFRPYLALINPVADSVSSPRAAGRNLAGSLGDSSYPPGQPWRSFAYRGFITYAERDKRRNKCYNLLAFPVTAYR